MEIVYSKEIPTNFSDKNIIGFYGDVLDLNIYDMETFGIKYDDEWKVSKFLNGGHLRMNKRIYDLLAFLDLDKSILNYKIKDISKVTFKYVLLTYILLNNIDIIIFDHIEVGMSYKEVRHVKQIIKELAKSDKKIIIITKDILFMNDLVEEIRVIEKKKEVYKGTISDLLESDIKFEEPKIVRFINMANRKGADLKMTLDNKELLKDIYRSVGK
jgi:ABC-type multidrug transport system ATPase subunit